MSEEPTVEELIAEAVRTTAEALARQFVTVESARAVAREAVPPSLRELDSQPPAGTFLRLDTGGGAAWSAGPTGEGLVALGDKVLYKGVFLREYDADGNLVAAGEDLNPADYASQAAYEAALEAAGHTLEPTWDWARATEDEV